MYEKSYQRDQLVKRWLHKRKGVLILLVLSLLVGYGMGKIENLVRNVDPLKSPKTVIELETKNETKKESGWIYVTGAVVKPGMYEFSENMKVADAIIQAGGFSTQVDDHYVASQLNVTDELTVGDRVFIPMKSSTLFQQKVSSAEILKNSSDVSRKVSINSDTAETLQSLEGIGEVRADKIITNRPYSNTYELVERKIIGEQLYKNIEMSISL